MSFPNVKNKHLANPLFSPSDFIKYMVDNNLLPDFKIPRGILLIYSRKLVAKIIENRKVDKIDLFMGDFYVLQDEDVGIFQGGIGAPGISTVMEEAIALGAKKFVSIGTAGGLQKSLKLGDVVLCTKAIRDEGVSHHYLLPAKYVEVSSQLLNSLRKSLANGGLNFVEGPTWTIDAPYRETIDELKAYQEEGVMTVEMEASALAAVAQFRKVEFATAFVISDLLGELVWSPQFQTPEVLGNLTKIANLAIELLKK